MDAENEGEIPNDKKTTLGALGAQLPTGSAKGAREMESKPWRMKEEREIGALRQRMQKAGVGEFVAALVGAMYVSLGGLKLESMKDAERVAAVCRMPMGDVMYAYAYLRRQALGPDLDFSVGCPECGHQTQSRCSLDDLDVTLGVPGETWTYKLVTPVAIRGETAREFKLQPPAWEVMRRVAGKTNASLVKAEMARVSVVGIDSRPPIAITPNDLDELTKVDVEGLSASITDHSAGPDFAIEVKCEKCQALVQTALDWGYDAFFSMRSGR